MSTPLLSLLLFAMWTLLILFSTVGVYRWSRILTGRATLAQWTAGADTGKDWYRRAMRAHANCIENLPVFGAIVLVIEHLNIQTELLNILSIIVVLGRVAQSLVHISMEQSSKVVGIRFFFYMSQIISMIAMTIYIFI